MKKLIDPNTLTKTELLSMFEESLFRATPIPKDDLRNEIIRRMKAGENAEGVISIAKENLPYPGDPEKDHPFELQLRSHRIQSACKDAEFVADLYSILATKVLRKSRVLTDTQLDYLLDTYIASKERAAEVVAKLAKNKPEYFLKQKYLGTTPHSKAYKEITRIGWSISDRPPSVEPFY